MLSSLQQNLSEKIGRIEAKGLTAKDACCAY